MTRVIFKLVQLGIVVCGLALSGCAALQALQGQTPGSEVSNGPGYQTHNTDLSDTEGIRTAVEDAQQYLHEQDSKIRSLFEMRADLEEKIHDLQEGQIGRLDAETEALRKRVDSVENTAKLARHEIDTQWAPVQALAEAQAGELINLKESMIAIVEETHQDRQLTRNNLKNYRDALVEFHALMVKLETLVLDEEFRAMETETAIKKNVKNQGVTLTRLNTKYAALEHLQKRTTQLHRYINEVQKNLRQAVNTWQAGASGGEDSQKMALEDQQDIFANTLSLDGSTERTGRETRPVLVPEVDQVLEPFEAPTTLISNEKTPDTGPPDAEGGTTGK